MTVDFGNEAGLQVLVADEITCEEDNTKNDYDKQDKANQHECRNLASFHTFLSTKEVFKIFLRI